MRPLILLQYCATGVSKETSLDLEPDESPFPIWQNEEVYRDQNQAEAKTIILKREDWEGMGGAGMRTVPPQFLDLLHTLDMIQDGWYWRWWRAQATAYLVRSLWLLCGKIGALQATCYLPTEPLHAVEPGFLHSLT